jgi:V/A-type H+-transporting ATPase subunit K
MGDDLSGDSGRHRSDRVSLPGFCPGDRYRGEGLGAAHRQDGHGIGLTLALAGSAMGLVVSFQALLAGGGENFYKNIAVALMPSTQGIYGMVVFFTNMDKFDSAPYTIAGKAMIAGVAMWISGWYQGIVCAAGIKSILEGKNTVANALVAGAMPETYAVFALVMTFIMK